MQKREDVSSKKSARLADFHPRKRDLLTLNSNLNPNPNPNLNPNPNPNLNPNPNPNLNPNLNHE